MVVNDVSHGILYVQYGMAWPWYGIVMVVVYQGGINGGHVKSLPPDGRLRPDEWADAGIVIVTINATFI